MKTYTYAVFLRNPETKEVQHGTIEIDHDGFIDCHLLFEKMTSKKIKKDLNNGYTLISMQIVSVEDSSNENQTQI